MGKDVGLRIRLERALRDEFLEACRAQDRPAAQVLREFMREYVGTHQSEAHTQDVTVNRERARRMEQKK